MARQHAKPSGVRDRRIGGAAGDLLTGMGQVKCPGCEAPIIFMASDRPERCRMCDTELPKPEPVVAEQFEPMRNTAANRQRLASYKAKMAKVYGETHSQGGGHGKRQKPTP